jgi:Fe-S cluster biosynthesis and repair protein YggX
MAMNRNQNKILIRVFSRNSRPISLYLRASAESASEMRLSASGSCYNTPMPRMVKCVKLGRELPGLNEPPFDTELGQKIYENVSAEAWKMWAEHSKMLLNEYRLQPWKPEAQQFLVEQMQQYFFGSGAQLPKEFVPPPK